MMTPPAVRILVRERLAVPEPAAFLQRLLDFRVRIEHTLTAEQFHRVEKVSRRTDRRVDFKPVAVAGAEVVSAVARRGVDRTRAGVERDVVAEHADRVALI